MNKHEHQHELRPLARLAVRYRGMVPGLRDDGVLPTNLLLLADAAGWLIEWQRLEIEVLEHHIAWLRQPQSEVEAANGKSDHAEYRRRNHAEYRRRNHAEYRRLRHQEEDE